MRVYSSPDKKPWLPTALKCSVSAFLLYWVLHSTNLVEILATVRSANLFLLAQALLVYFAGYLVRAYRWRLLLRLQGVKASIPFLYKSYMVGIFFSNFLPSTVGGDVVRAHDIWRLGTSRSRAMVTVFTDRFLGLIGLLMFAAGTLLLSPHLLVYLPLQSLWRIVAVSSGVLLVLALLMRRLTVYKLWRLCSRKLQRFLTQVLEAFRAFGQRQALLKALGWSMVVQVSVIVHYYLIEKALGISVPFSTFFLIVPLATLIMMLPISINAIGLRENAFVFLLGTYGYGIGRSEAIAFAWLAYGIVIIQGLIGGVIYALRK